MKILFVFNKNFCDPIRREREREREREINRQRKRERERERETHFKLKNSINKYIYSILKKDY